MPILPPRGLLGQVAAFLAQLGFGISCSLITKSLAGERIRPSQIQTNCLPQFEEICTEKEVKDTDWTHSFAQPIG